MNRRYPVEILQQLREETKQTYSLSSHAPHPAGMLLDLTCFYEVMRNSKRCEADRKFMLRGDAEHRRARLAKCLPGIVPACLVFRFFFFSKSSWSRAAGRFRFRRLICPSRLKYAQVRDVAIAGRRPPRLACAQEILKTNARHSCFHRTAHMRGQEIYHRFSEANFNKSEGKKTNIALHLDKETLGWTSRPDIRNISVMTCCRWICVSACAAGMCQEFPVISCCLSWRQVNHPYRNEKQHDRKTHVLCLVFVLSCIYTCEVGHKRKDAIDFPVPKQCPGNCQNSQVLCPIRKIKQPSFKFP